MTLDMILDTTNNLIGGEAIAAGGFGCVFRPALKCSGISGRSSGVSKLSIKKYTNEEYDEISKILPVIERIPNNEDYFIAKGITMCTPDVMRADDLTHFDRKCSNLTKRGITKKNVNAIVHSHSKSCVTLACIRKKIPAFNYMVAVAGGIDIKCAKYATFGTVQLSKNIIKVLQNRTACLIENHGQVAVGKNIDSAFELALEVENLASQYINCLRIGRPKILSKSLMSKVLGKIKNYKKERSQ